MELSTYTGILGWIQYACQNLKFSCEGWPIFSNAKYFSKNSENPIVVQKVFYSHKDKINKKNY